MLSKSCPVFVHNIFVCIVVTLSRADQTFEWRNITVAFDKVWLKKEHKLLLLTYLDAFERRNGKELSVNFHTSVIAVLVA